MSHEERIEDFHIDRVMKRKKILEDGPREIYYCKICKKVQAPTTERNIRCSGCRAPLIASLEKITDLKRSIKNHYKNPEKINFIKKKIQLIRSMRKQYAELRKQSAKQKKEYVVRQKQRTTVDQVLKKVRETNLIFHVTDVAGTKFVLKLKDANEIKKMFNHAEKIGAKVEYKGTERELAVMEDMKQVIINNDKAEKET